MIQLLFGAHMRRLSSLVAGLLFFICAQGQSPLITNVSFNNAATYFPGGSISLHFKPDGVFPLDTKFTLQLLDAAGTTVINNNIGIVNDFFVPVLNGTLPADLPQGNYRIRVVAESGGMVLTNSPPTAVFSVQANPEAYTAPKIDNPSALLKVNCFKENNYFGFLDRKTGDLTPSNLGFQIPDDVPGYTYTAHLVRHPSGQRVNMPVTTLFGTPSFNLPAGLPTDYYTIEVTKSKDNFSSVYSYVFLFNTGNTTLANVGPENVCVFSEVLFSINFQTLEKNYPGSYYTINYGDGSQPDIYTQARLRYDPTYPNILISHIYTVATCKASPELNKNGRFEVQILLFNKGANPNATDACNVYSRNGNGTIKLVNTSIAPEAIGGGPSIICINRAATFINSTINGVYGDGTECKEEPNVTWFIKPPNAANFTPVPASWYIGNPNKNLRVPAGIFNIVGIWEVKIAAQNPEGCTTISEDIIEVCVEPELMPDFTMNGLQAIAGCAPFDINVKNLTPRSPCQEYGFSWKVLDSLGIDNVPLENYTFTKGPDTLHPSLRFFKEGKYLLRLTVENSCGPVMKDKPIEILGVTDVNFPQASSIICGSNRIINFATDPNFKPAYNTSFSSGDVYNWQISGGAFSFENGTSAASRFPQVLFKDFATYTIQLTYTNSCGTKTISMDVTFDEPVTADAGPSSISVCFNDKNIFLNASVNGPATGLQWTTSGTGTFTQLNNTKSTYTFSAQDKSNGSVQLIFTAFAPASSACTDASDTINVTIKPQVTADDFNGIICSGQSVDYTPTGNQPSATYTWTSTVTSGSVTGNTPSGSGTITDILINNGNTNGVVTYTIVPSFDGCTGNAGKLVVTVQPNPLLTTSPDKQSICSGDVSNIQLTSNVAGAVFTWTASAPSTLLGYSNGSGTAIQQTITNSGNSVDTVTYTVTAHNGTCAGETKVVKVAVYPRAAKPVVVSPVFYCLNSTALPLQATAAPGNTLTWYDNPGLTGGSPIAPIPSTATPGTVNYYVNQKNVYGCVSDVSIITVTTYDLISNNTIGSDQTLCAGTASAPLGQVSGNVTGGSGTYTYQWQSSTNGVTWTDINGASDPSYSPGAINTTTRFRRLVTGGPCSNTSNEVVITIKGVLTNYEIGSDQTICEGNAPALLVGQQPGGGSGTFAYQWQSSPDNSTWTDINGATARDYQPPVLTSTTYYHRIVISSPCTATSAPVKITVNPLPNGSISADAASICEYDAGAVSFTATAGTAPFAVRLTVTGPGGTKTIDQNIGGNGPVSIQVVPAGSAPGNYTVNLVKITDSKGCERSGTLSAVSITVKTAPVVTVSPAAPSICFGSSVTLTASGAATYQWSPAGGLNTTDGNVVIANPASTTTYTVTGTTEGCSATATVKVTVNPKPEKPGVNSPVTYCQNEAAAALTATAAPGHTLKWYDNPGLTNGTTVAPVPSTATPGTVNYYVTQINSFNCESEAAVISVITLPAISNNIIGSDQTLCAGTVPAPLTPQGNITGGNGSFTYQWQNSTNGGTTWNDINSATDASFAPGALTTTTIYRRVANSGSCTSTSNIVVITVQGTLTNYEIGSNQTICDGSTPALLVGQQPAGGSGTFIYQWQSSADNSNWTDINGATSKDYQPPALAATTYYRRKVTSGECSAFSGPVSVTVNPIPVVEQVADITVNNGVQVPGVIFNSTPSANVTITWTNDNTGIGLGASGTGNLPVFTATNKSNPKVPITGTITVIPKFTQNGVSCPGNPMTFTITVLPTLTILPIPDTIVCTGTTIAEFTPKTDAGPNSQISFRWVVTGSGITLTDGSGPFIPSYQAVNNGTTDLVATITVTPILTDNGVTSEGTPESYTVTVKPGTPAANAGPDQTLCAVTEYTMQAVAENGTTGKWTQTMGSNVTIVNPSSPVTKITGLQPGTTYGFEWTLTGFSGCPSTKDAVVITNRPVLTKAAAGADQAICDWVNTGTATLDANKDAARPFEVYEWSIVSKPSGSVAAISDIFDPKATLTVDKAGAYTLAWTITNDAGCEPSTDQVTITAYDKPVAGTVSGNANTCAGNDVTLNLDGFTGLILKWQYNPAPVDDNIWLDRAVTTSTITFTNVQGSFSVRAIVRSAGFADGCTSEEITEPLLINVAPPSNPGTTGPDATVCYGSNSGTITLTGNVGSVVRWEYSDDKGASWTAVDNTTNTITYNDLTVTRWYRAAVQSGTCGIVFSNATVITVQPPVTNNVIAADQSICTGNVAAPLTGSTPVGGNGTYHYQWQQSTDGGATWTDIPGATEKNYDPSTVSVTTRYRRNVTTSLCAGLPPNTSNEVTITVNPDAKAEFTFTKDVDCSPFELNSSVITLKEYPDQNGSYEWYADGVLLGTGTTFPGYTITGSGKSVTIRLVAISKSGCKNDAMQHVFTTVTEPLPSFTVSPAEGCGPLTVQFTNTTPSPSGFTFHWDFGNGQTSDEAQPGPVTFQTNPTFDDTVYIVTLTGASVCKGISVTHTVRVKSKPKAVFTPDKTTGCSPLKVTFRNNSLGAGSSTYTWDFGDGSAPVVTTSTDPVTHTFITDERKTFTVKLKAENECGSDEYELNIVVTPNTIDLNVVIPGDQLSGCTPHTVSFSNSSKGATLFRWDFGDGTVITTTKNIDVVLHTYVDAGTYRVTVNASNSCSEASRTLPPIEVLPTPVAAFDMDPSAACLGETIRLTNNSVNANAYLWDFGDGRTSNTTAKEVTHAYTTPGTFIVKLTAIRSSITGSECTDTEEKTITITSTIAGWFDMSPEINNCPPATITFTNRNTPSVSAVWDFGDGTTGNGNVVTHTYTKAGDYEVKLTSRSQGGCTYITTRTVSVKGPSGTLSYTGGNVCNNAAVRFEVTATNTNTLIWDFGDGVTLTTTDVVVHHIYANAGTYTPSVTLLNNSGCTVLLKGTAAIKVDKVKSGFTHSMQLECGSTTLRLTDTSNAFSGKALVLWRLGDGTIATGSSVTKKYTVTGDYTIQQVVTGNSGCSDSTTKTIHVQVNSQPKASILAENTYCNNTPIILNGVIQSADPITSLKWFVSNGATGTTNPYQLNLVPGTYTVRLQVGTANGCFDEATHSFTVNPSPIVRASNDITLCRGNSTQLSAAGALQYSWSPIEGLSCSSCPNPVATPLQTTRYIVSGTNSFGCSATDTVLTTVIQPVKLDVKPSDTMCIGQSVQLVARGADVYNWSPPTGLSATNISNPVARPVRTTIYRVEGRDSFNCFTDVAFVQVVVGPYPTISLGPDLTLATGTKHRFSPVIQNGPAKSWLWTPPTDLDCPTCGTPEATVKRDITYVARITNIYGCSASDTISIKAFCQNTQVFIPNAFTPDGDGINDLLMVRASGIAAVKSFRIFNRWGELVFEKSDFAPNDPRFGWDGKIRGIAGVAEVYVYTAEVVCENGVSFVYKGNVSLLK